MSGYRRKCRKHLRSISRYIRSPRQKKNRRSPNQEKMYRQGPLNCKRALKNVARHPHPEGRCRATFFKTDILTVNNEELSPQEEVVRCRQCSDGIYQLSSGKIHDRGRTTRLRTCTIWSKSTGFAFGISDKRIRSRFFEKQSGWDEKVLSDIQRSRTSNCPIRNWTIRDDAEKREYTGPNYTLSPV